MQAGMTLDPGTPRLISEKTPLSDPDVWDFSFDAPRMRWVVIKAAAFEELPSEVSLVAGWFNELKNVGSKR